MNFYIGDLHIGHENIIKYDNRPFKDSADMSREIIRRWNGVVSPEDNVYILGDFIWKNSDGIEVLKQLVGKKYLIIGNHDKPRQDMFPYFEWLRYYEEIDDNGTLVAMTHNPSDHHYIWFNDCDHYKKVEVRLFSHLHDKEKYEPLERIREFFELCGHNLECYNVGCMMPYMDYTPRTLEEIRKSGNQRRLDNE